MQKIDLFPTTIYKTQIDPSSWDKDQFVLESIKSYNIDPKRHVKNMPDSEYHTTYLDWDNKKFNTINLDSIKQVYSKVVSDFFESIRLSRHIEYKWTIINISIGKDNWYDWHYHGVNLDKDNYSNDYVMVHYIKFDGDVHRPTAFQNPLTFMNCKNSVPLKTILDCSYVENSSFYPTYELNTNENDVIIFPSYLKHGVMKKNSNTEKFRIISSTHIDIRYTNEEIYG